MHIQTMEGRQNPLICHFIGRLTYGSQTRVGCTAPLSERPANPAVLEQRALASSVDLTTSTRNLATAFFTTRQESPLRPGHSLAPSDQGCCCDEGRKLQQTLPQAVARFRPQPLPWAEPPPLSQTQRPGRTQRCTCKAWGCWEEGGLRCCRAEGEHWQRTCR